MDDSLKHEVSLLHANICQALADSTRILLLYAVSEGPRRVGELAAELELPQSTVSRHLKVLHDRHVVSTERDGAVTRYSLADGRVIEALDLLRAVLTGALHQQARLAERLI